MVVDGGGQSPLLTIGHDESVGDEEVDLMRGVGKIVIEDKFWLCLWSGTDVSSGDDVVVGECLLWCGHGFWDAKLIKG